MILKEQGEKIVYSDGESIEEKMLEIAKAYPEDASQDYIASNSEYTINNTFSSVRQNILNWYPFREGCDILEVGAGMGSITGMLCDRARHVTAVEMSKNRADVIRARYSERKNLSVISENVMTWKTEQKFDYVVMIGVLEYAAVFSDEEDPFVKFLKCVSGFLKDDGRLLFAIENRFGIKYWLGAAEDHIQEPYVGIEGYEKKGTPRTFSKYELEKMVKTAGFKSHKFYYVYPDYKFPETIYTDEFKPDFSALRKVSFTYSKNSLLILDEKKLYKDLVENGVWQFFANSYLVEAFKNTPSEGEKEVLHVSAKGETRKQFRASTVIMNDNKAYKVPMHRQAITHIENICQNTSYLKSRGIKVVDVEEIDGCAVSELYHGLPAQEYFRSLLENNDRSALFELIENLRNNLLRSSEMEYKYDNCILNAICENAEKYKVGPILSKGFVDMTFYNAFYEDKALVFYDQEWCFEAVPLNFILYYAVKSAFYRLKADTEITFEELLGYLGIGENRELFDKLEEYIWSQILYRQTDFYGADGYCNRFSEEKTLRHRFQENKQIEEEKNALLEEKNALQRHLENERKRNIEEQTQLRQEIRNKEGHIELLLPAEREYKKIINSRMFKVMRFLCRSYDILMVIPRIVVKNVAAFCRMMTHVNIQELKIAWGYVRKEGFKGAYAHLMRDYHQGELKPIKVDVHEKVYEPIENLETCDVLELPRYEEPLVSIIIPAYNQFTFTYYCIESILKNSGDIPYEVILADDCSNDLTVDISKVVKNLIIARTETNQLFLRNCNQAAQKARGKYVLFLNNDTQVQKDWLKPLVELCENNHEIGIVGSKLVYSDGVLQEAGGIIWKDGSGWNYGRNDDAMKPEYNYVREADYISGAAIMLPKKLWDHLGGFDEYFAPAYCEDSDLAFRVRKAGYKVVYQPLSVVVHFEGRSNGTDLNEGVKKYQVENSIKLKERWKSELSSQYELGQCVFKARERSKDKKVILVIDHYVPQFDKDAGSKTTIQYLRMFVEKGYVVKFIGDNFFQHEPYTTVLQQMGIEVLYGPWYAEHWKEWILENKNDIDFVYLNRPHITIKYIDFIRQNTKIKCIYYGHDLHFLRLEREYELNGDSAKKAEAEEWKKTELYIMRKADISYYPSYVEENEIHRIDSEIPVKAITAYVYEQFRNNIPKDFTKREGIVFVGGFGHPPNADAVIWFAKEIYPRIKEKVKMPFYIVGSNPTPEIEALNSEDIIVKGFVSEEELARLYDTCRLVVVPLRYGAGVKGKVVEALYYGTPIVTTSVGAEGIQDIEKWVQIADDAETFSQKVVDLYQDTNQLAQTVDNYQKFIKDKFSIEAVWDIVKDDFQ